MGHPNRGLPRRVRASGRAVRRPVDAPADPDRWLRGWRVWALGFTFWTAIGLLTFSYYYLDVFVRGRREPFYEKLIEELTGAYGTGLLFPLVVYYTRTLRRTLPHWSGKFGLHLPGVVVFSVLHTTWNAITRQLTYAAVGLGAYDYGLMSIRYAMEFPNDLIGYGIFVGFTYLFDHYRRARDREVQVARLERELTQVRLRSLESQLQPHFLFNALNTVSSVMYEDPAAADKMLSGLADLLRRSLRSEGRHEVALSEELESLRLYLDIMRQRFAERLQVRTAVAEDVGAAVIPPFLLQPLVENALQHGDPGPERPAHITVDARRQNGRLHVEIRDNGPGITEPAGRLIQRGIGLQNTDRRLRHLYGSDYSFELHNGMGGGLVVTIDIPYRTTPSANDVSHSR